MNVSSWSILKVVPVVVVLTPPGLSGLQFFCWPLLRDLDLQTIQVSATLQGAAPSQFEVDVGRKIEDHLVALSRPDHIATLITDGSILINVSFARDKNGAEALSEVRDAVDSVCADRPSGMASPTPGAAFLSYTMQSVALGAAASRGAIRPGVLRGDCPLAAGGGVIAGASRDSAVTNRQERA